MKARMLLTLALVIPPLPSIAQDATLLHSVTTGDYSNGIAFMRDESVFLARNSALEVWWDHYIPLNPPFLSQTLWAPGGASDVVWGGDSSFSARSTSVLVTVWDELYSHMEVGTFPIANAGGSTLSRLQLTGNRLYVSTNDRLIILDASQPGIPIELGTYVHQSPPGLFGWTMFWARDDRAYLHLSDADDQGFLQVLDVSDPAAITERGFLPLGPTVLTGAIVVEGDHAFMVSFEGTNAESEPVGGIDVVNISDPDAPVAVGLDQLPTIFYAEKLLAIGDRLYVPTLGGVRRIDISTPSALVELDPIPTADTAVTLAMAREFLPHLVVGHQTGFQLFSLVDPDGDGVLSDNCPTVPTPLQNRAACLCGDVSGDGFNDIADVVRIRRYVAGMGPDLPAPHLCNLTEAPGGQGPTLAGCTEEDGDYLRNRLVKSPSGLKTTNICWDL